MFYLDPYQQKVDLADDDIFQVVPDNRKFSFQGVG